VARIAALLVELMEWLECHSWRRSWFRSQALFRNCCNAWFPLLKKSLLKD
jgi:hypothetical protein